MYNCSRLKLRPGSPLTDKKGGNKRSSLLGFRYTSIYSNWAIVLVRDIAMKRQRCVFNKVVGQGNVVLVNMHDAACS